MARILCVDDEPHVASFRSLLLRKAGHFSKPVWTVHDAIQTLTEEEYDIVITGWRLCDGNAGSILHAAKSLPDAPKVVISAFVTEDTQVPGVTADLYFEKPIDPDLILEVVDHLLREDA